ncbi:flagellar hook capping FlgD N-terminal domain-containing protein [Rhodovulum steppense]|uniref:Basal-body rod modification protein FlgD n=1 Tax=Rhodovulum steppense TaxID=540251 RepID=A0A4R1Z0F3_9RHOB|nr:flagellar hook capping FlgD N-terminal domain-containing protein [Rhodovulum steppense]TCM87045.1 flagellar basal-body rod modification protein FlgD [Rhodovulum steppense]
MTSVTYPTAATTTAATTTAASPSAKAANISSDFETFLKMLTVQMKNQDPLNPIESTDYAVQLATFSGVEQQVRTNDLLKQLTENMGGAGLAQYGTWVGMEGRAAVPAQFTGTPITVLPQPLPAADSAQLVVRNASGREVQRLPIATDGSPVQWTGVGQDGATLASGRYSFVVESFSEGARIGESAAEIYAPIVEVRSDASGVKLVFQGGGETSASNVTALRQPG